MKYCRDCHQRVHVHELYCPRCGADLYSKPRLVKHGLLENLAHFRAVAR